nr:MAG TPA: hypothetical protein [Caudoviricetes sp.]
MIIICCLLFMFVLQLSRAIAFENRLLCYPK